MKEDFLFACIVQDMAEAFAFMVGFDSYSLRFS